MRILASVLLMLSVGGCAAALRVNTAAIGDSIADLQRTQVISNLARVLENDQALPSQYEIGSGSAEVTTGVNPSILPGLNFRAIAITGVGLSNTNSFKQNFGLSPVSGVSDLRMLQTLYRYATYSESQPPNSGRPRNFADLREQLSDIAAARGPFGAAFPPATVLTGKAFIDMLSNIIGELPPAPLVVFDDACPSSATRIPTPRRTACFRQDADTESRFILWVSAVTQDVFSPTAQAAQPLTPPGVVPAPPAVSQSLRSGIRRRPETLVAPAPSFGGL